ncbi:MAG: hypothetical protein VW582_12545 [Rhodospirillaceae bacterium]
MAVSGLGDSHARIAPGMPAFRLSSPGWADFATRDLELVTSGERLFELVREKLNTKLPTFAVRLRQFVDLYVDHGLRAVADEFGSETGPLVTAEDWIYSAFLPLPNARVEIPDSGPSEFAEFGVFFWTGERAIGVLLEPAASIIGRKRRNLDRLAEAWPSLTVIEAARDRFPGDDSVFADDLLPPELMRFWDGLDMPQGPSVSGVLETPFVPR